MMCLGILGGMIGLTVVSPTLYDLFCEVTGYGGTPVISENAPKWEVQEQKVKVFFDANKDGSLPWEFTPTKKNITVAIGSSVIATYKVRNLSDKEITGTAVFNITPLAMGQYIHKIECFCFSNQTLKPGEEALLPVEFSFDPAMLKDSKVANLNAVTFSYTFYLSPDNFKSDGEEGLFDKGQVSPPKKNSINAIAEVL